MPTETSGPAETPMERVLVVHVEVAVMRLIREALENFTMAEVATTPNAEYAFELALQRQYKLFILQLTMPVIGGELLYNLISKAYKHSHEGVRSPPAVIYLAEEQDAHQYEELLRDARVKGILMKPLGIERLLDKASTVLTPK